jgi:hypothetical protein
MSAQLRREFRRDFRSTRMAAMARSITGWAGMAQAVRRETFVIEPIS